MTDLTNLDARVTKLEREMPEARKLASDASKEVGDVRTQLRAHTKLLQALRETQVEQGKEMRQGFAEVSQEFARLEGEMRQGFSVMAVGMAQITAQLAIAIDQSEEPDES